MHALSIWHLTAAFIERSTLPGATKPRCSTALGTAKQKEQIGTAAKARAGSNKIQGSPEATELKSALAS